MRRYSIIVFNDKLLDLSSLLRCLVSQTLVPFEVLVIEECLHGTCEVTVNKFKNTLNIRYYNKTNSGIAYSRNFAFDEAQGDYFIVLDPSCDIPPDYLRNVDKALNENYLDSFVGVVRSKDFASKKERGIAYALNSYYSMEAWKEGKLGSSKIHFQEKNMGLSREVFEKTMGYTLSNDGNEIEFTIRVQKLGFKVGLIPEAIAYHSRMNNFKNLFQAMYHRGKGRINVYRFFPEKLKYVHFFPLIFLVLCILSLIQLLVYPIIDQTMLMLVVIFAVIILVDSLRKLKDGFAALWSVPAVFVELWGYGIGFFIELYKELSGKKRSI